MAAMKNNSVRTKQRMAPPLPKTPSKAPTMRSTAKDIVSKAKSKVSKDKKNAKEAFNARARARGTRTIANNSVKIVSRIPVSQAPGSVPKPFRPNIGPTGLMTKADMSAIKSAKKANARGLKAANKPAGYISADAARSKALERAKATPPSKRTAAQKLAIKMTLADFNPTQRGKIKATTPNRLTDTKVRKKPQGSKMKRVPNIGGRGRMRMGGGMGGGGGLRIDDMNR